MDDLEKERIRALIPKIKAEKAKEAAFAGAYAKGRSKLTKAQLIAMVDELVSKSNLR